MVSFDYVRSIVKFIEEHPSQHYDDLAERFHNPHFYLILYGLTADKIIRAREEPPRREGLLRGLERSRFSVNQDSSSLDSRINSTISNWKLKGL